MTDKELIDKILKSKKPSDIFNGDWKKEYLQYSKLIHPDACSAANASNAMAVMNAYKDVIENGVKFIDEAGEFRVFEKKIVYVVTDANRKLITKSVDNYKKLMSLRDKASVSFQRYLPQSMILEKEKLTINLAYRSIPLTGHRLPQGHINWLFSRMFEFCVWLRQVDLVHMGFNPTTVFVDPEGHGIVIVSFYHMTTTGRKAETISAKYKMWYPTTLFTEKIATPDVDLELCKKIAIYLLGDRSAAGTKLKVDKEVNQPMLSFLLTKHQNTKDEYLQYRKLLEKHFEKKFYPLDL